MARSLGVRSSNLAEMAASKTSAPFTKAPGVIRAAMVLLVVLLVVLVVLCSVATLFNSRPMQSSTANNRWDVFLLRVNFANSDRTLHNFSVPVLVETHLRMTANTASNAMDRGRALSGACSQMRLINANASEGDADADAEVDDVDDMDEATIGELFSLVSFSTAFPFVAELLSCSLSC